MHWIKVSCFLHLRSQNWIKIWFMWIWEWYIYFPFSNLLDRCHACLYFCVMFFWNIHLHLGISCQHKCESTSKTLGRARLYVKKSSVKFGVSCLVLWLTDCLPQAIHLPDIYFVVQWNNDSVMGTAENRGSKIWHYCYYALQLLLYC